ncbi:hypothetical protein DBR06_SOUSAS19410012 [Sousa chinensis]|nr:hypothetical protein DBR06_SOUSAS19410012 [Sousa chinensis]
MKNQVCSKCGEGTYSLGSGIKFDEWDELPAGFSNVATFMDTVVGPSDSRPDGCNKFLNADMKWFCFHSSSWVPRGNYIESNRDDCTVSLIYAVHLKKSGYVFFEYQYVDNNIFFEFFIQNDQCQEMDTTADKWVKLTDSGVWGSHSGWRTHRNAFHASLAPSATSQVHSSAKCVPETPILRKEPKNASGVTWTPSFQHIVISQKSHIRCDGHSGPETKVLNGIHTEWSHNINDSFLKFVFLLQKKDPASVRSVLPVPQKTISRSTLHVMRKERLRRAHFLPVLHEVPPYGYIQAHAQIQCLRFEPQRMLTHDNGQWGKAGQECLDSCDWEITAEQRVLSRLSLALLADILSSVLCSGARYPLTSLPKPLSPSQRFIGGLAEVSEKTLALLESRAHLRPAILSSTTQIMYKWIEPKICREDLTDAIRLPPSGEKKDCPPCNPGFYNNGSSSCHPCPPGTFSDGTKECRPCPAGTEPALGFEYKWWNVLPGNMKTSCFNVGNSKCDGMNGWEVAGDHIQSGAGGSDNDYLILNLHIPGFKPPTSMTGAMGSELGRITFVFETLCSADCILYFMVDINRKSTNVVESWGGTKEKQAYTHVIFKNATFTFTWAFQRTNQGQDNRRFINDMVKIYSITAANAVDGVASSCRACALGSEQLGSSCVPCPPGHYIEKETNQCKECPPDTYLSIHQVYGKEACILCGPGSRSTQDHSVCYSDCFFYYEKENQSLHYDFSNLSSVGSLMNGPSFTSKGTKYFHFFNISLCGHEGKKLALCTNNITDFTVKEMVAGSDDYTNLVGAFVCQSTIIPSESKGFRAALSSQSIILADVFLGVTVETTLQNINIKEDMFPVSPSQIPDVHFFYKSSTTTTSCVKGRSTAVKMRCNPAKPGAGTISVPSKCPAGTCDGCTFYFLWESAEACPLCTEHDFHEIEGACKRGFQETLYVWNEPKWCIKGISLPEKKLSTCETVDFWLKVGAGVGAFAAVLLVALTCYFWKKNQKLEYKYSKLVMTTNSKECELPAADSCAIMEGEDNEEEVVYSNKQSLLGKLKSLATKYLFPVVFSFHFSALETHPCAPRTDLPHISFIFKIILVLFIFILFNSIVPPPHSNSLRKALSNHENIGRNLTSYLSFSPLKKNNLS